MRNAIVILLLPGLLFAAPAAIQEGPHQKLCETLLSLEIMNLNGLLETGIVVKRGAFTYSTEKYVSRHELRTASLLAERLQQPLALIPYAIDDTVPAVDGIFFDDLGNPVSNFSLKSVSAKESKDLNRTIKNAIARAEEMVDYRYSIESWKEVAESRGTRKHGGAYKDSVLNAKLRIFGLNGRDDRPVSIVIDYSEMPNAVLHLQRRSSDGSDPSKTFISLDRSKASLLEIDSFVRKVRTELPIREYIFLGTHHLLRITPEGYSLTEFCDTLGHMNCGAH